MASKIKVDTLETANGSGTIALSNQLSGMTSASMPSGSVIQIVHGESTTQVGSTSSTYADTGLTAAITPSSTSSKILVTVHQSGLGKDSNNTRIGIAVLRGSTNIGLVSGQAGFTGSTAINFIATASGEFLDSPSSTSAVTYKTQINSYANNANVWLNLGGTKSTITLTEIKG
jgi:hypothetical protein